MTEYTTYYGRLGQKAGKARFKKDILKLLAHKSDERCAAKCGVRSGAQRRFSKYMLPSFGKYPKRDKRKGNSNDGDTLNKETQGAT